MLNEALENNSYRHPDLFPYWPTGDSVKTGVISTTKYNVYSDSDGTTVKLISKKDFGFYAVSELELSTSVCGESRKVFHLHFQGWHDYEIPASPTQFIEFLKVARTYYELNTTAPPIVHCSAGVGRTGSFVLVDTVLRIIQEKQSMKTEDVDIPEILEIMRQERMWLVQTPDQLRFCFQAILEGAHLESNGSG